MFSFKEVESFFQLDFNTNPIWNIPKKCYYFKPLLLLEFILADIFIFVSRGWKIDALNWIKSEKKIAPLIKSLSRMSGNLIWLLPNDMRKWHGENQEQPWLPLKKRTHSTDDVEGNNNDNIDAQVFTRSTSCISRKLSMLLVDCECVDYEFLLAFIFIELIVCVSFFFCNLPK